jgi:hypothetical protein
MGIRAYLKERRRKKNVDLLLVYIFSKLAEGYSITDILVWNLESPVEWDRERAVWTVFSPEELESGQRVYLLSGRGGVDEEARVVDGTAVEGGFICTLVFGTWQFDSDSDKGAVRLGDLN